MIVAIHQPNFLPWLGYFHKIARADAFVFLDDAQYTKNSFINRVRVLGPDGPRWLTLPVSYDFGEPIDRVRPARPDWPSRHLDTLRTLYGDAPAFREVWPKLAEMIAAAPAADLAAINRHLIEAAAGELGLSCRFLAASDMDVPGKADDRLVGLVAAVEPGAVYLSGEGGAKYQDADKFSAAGLSLTYAGFAHPAYPQGRADFEAGLSVVDAVFHLGWAGAAELLASA